MKENNFEEHPCTVDKKDEKLRIRFWPKNKSRNGNCEFTLKLTDVERIQLIHC